MDKVTQAEWRLQGFCLTCGGTLGTSVPWRDCDGKFPGRHKIECIRGWTSMYWNILRTIVTKLETGQEIEFKDGGEKENSILLYRDEDKIELLEFYYKIYDEYKHENMELKKTIKHGETEGSMITLPWHHDGHVSGVHYNPPESGFTRFHT